MLKELVKLSMARGFLLLSLLLISGCKDMEIKGKTYQQSYTDQQVVALIKAACSGNIKKLEQLVSAGADVNAMGEHGSTPLIWVMLAKNYQGVEALLKLGANPNQRFDQGYTPMWFAAGGDDIKLLKLLLQYGGDVDIWAEGKSPLVLAALQDRTAHYELLIEYGADINSADIVGNTLATWYEALAYYEKLLGLLESGYHYDLDYLARRVANSQVSETAPQWQWRKKVIGKLKQMGVSYPPVLYTGPELTYMRLKPSERVRLEQAERDGKLPSTSRGQKRLDDDRELEKQANYQAKLEYDKLFGQLEKGYCENTVEFALWVEDNPVPINTPQWQWRNKVIEKLKIMRVYYPPRRAKKMRLTEKYRATLERLEAGGKLMPGSNAAQFLARDRALQSTVK
ncbi:ankyrin repeat domain-containing protein [Psychromonas sp. MME2]|uniref:ankyrin repeat domain-containing protein n=1 Tax=unclassified Psychromonas TaxID=2614957 RepID=UPI00339C2094